MLLFLYGEDTFRSNEKLAQIKAKFLAGNASGSGLGVFDYESEKFGTEIAGEFRSTSLFSQKRLIIVKNFLLSAPTDLKNEFLDKLNKQKSLEKDTDTVVVFWEGGKLKENLKIFKYLKDKSKSQEFGKLTGVKLAKWIEGRVSVINNKTNISSRAAQTLIAYAGDDLYFLENEIEKLTNFKNSGTISEEDVETLVKSKIEANIFQTIEALSGGNKKLAMKLLQEQIENGDDPFYIFSMYVYQYRNLLKIGDFFWQGVSNKFEIAKRAKLHPFVVEKGLAQIRNTSLQKLKSIYRELEKIDLNVKTGKTDIRLALDMFVAGI